MNFKYNVLLNGNKGYKITSPYGMRTLPGQPTKMHVGVDLVADYGNGIDEIVAPWDGTIVVEPYHPTSGNVVNISVNRQVYLTFRHLEEIYVKNGQKVTAGTKIALMGNTGSASTSTHLHFGILINGQYVDPKPYLTGELKLPGVNYKEEEDEDMGYPILTKTLKKGDKGDDVRNTQIVFQEKWLQPVNGIDGSFGNGMYEGVAAFQREHKLPVTHEVDAATIAELNKNPAELWRAEKTKLQQAIKILEG